MKLSSCCKTIAAILLFCRCLSATPSPVSFEYDGRTSLALEVIGPAHDPTADFAAVELQRYLSQILKRKLAWKRSDQQSPNHTCRIRLRADHSVPGEMPALPNGLASSTTDEFQIDANASSVTITASNPASLLYAVYQILQQQGCSWLFPGPAGETVPSKLSILIPGSPLTRADFSMRGLAPVENLQRYAETDVRDMMDWMAKNRMNYFVAIVNYGWDRLGNVILTESRKRGIHVVGYLWSFEVFLPMAVGQSHPEYFAFFDGKRHVDYNVKRCSASDGVINLFVENGCRWFHQHPEIEEWVVIPNDGFHWCECEKCRELKPKDQWAAFFAPLLQRLATESPGTHLQNFIYVTRYALPDYIAPYQTSRLDHFFDVHQRNKWFSLRDSTAPVDSGPREMEVDDRARGRPLNNYLADRLHEWRAAVSGRIWIFENLMLHGTYSIPVPNLPQIADDLKAARSDNVQGYLFEAYLQGWNSFAPDLSCLAQLCWKADTSPEALEKTYLHQLLGQQSQKLAEFYDNFRAEDLRSVRRGGSLYWMHRAPEAAAKYVAAIRSVNEQRLSPPGRTWLRQQLQVANLMEQLVRHGGHSGSSVVGAAQPAEILDLCSRALQKGRSMDGVFLAYEQLRQLFLHEFPTDALGFRPLLPDTFNPEVRDLFGHQKLWDTLAEWESASRFPMDPSDPDRALRTILKHAIANRKAHPPSQP